MVLWLFFALCALSLSAQEDSLTLQRQMDAWLERFEEIMEENEGSEDMQEDLEDMMNTPSCCLTKLQNR